MKSYTIKVCVNWFALVKRLPKQCPSVVYWNKKNRPITKRESKLFDII